MSVSPGAPALTVARLAALLQQAARELPVWDRGDPTYEPLAAWLLPRLAAEGPVSRGAPTPAMIAALIAHRWSATQVWPNDDAKVYCRCGTLLLGTTEPEAHGAWAAHVFEALRALTAQEGEP